MQGLYNFLLFIEVLSGILIAIFVLFQKTGGDGLMARTSNPFTSSEGSVSPMTKITRICVLTFLVNSLALSVTYNKMHKPKSLLSEIATEKEVSEKNSKKTVPVE